MFVFTLKTESKSVVIFQTKTNNEKTFVFVFVKKMNSSIKKIVKNSTK